MRPQYNTVELNKWFLKLCIYFLCFVFSWTVALSGVVVTWISCSCFNCITFSFFQYSFISKIVCFREFSATLQLIVCTLHVFGLFRRYGHLRSCVRLWFLRKCTDMQPEASHYSADYDTISATQSPRIVYFRLDVTRSFSTWLIVTPPSRINPDSIANLQWRFGGTHRRNDGDYCSSRVANNNKKGLGCNHAIYTVRRVVKNFVNGGNTVNLCSIDLSKAFAKDNHHALFMKRNLPLALLDLSENWLQIVFHVSSGIMFFCRCFCC